MQSGIIIGTAAYLLIKFCGYTIYSLYLNRLYRQDRNILVVGAARTIIGISFGLLVNYFLYSSLDVAMGRSPVGGEDTIVYLTLLAGLRVIEWSVIIMGFYTGWRIKADRSYLKGTGFGLLFSFFLDIPVMLGVLMVVATIC